MNTIVSFDIAKSLKDKGYDEPCEIGFTESGEQTFFTIFDFIERRYKNSTCHKSDFLGYELVICTAPTIS